MELNEKLARWAGFRWHKHREYVHGPLMHGGTWEDGHLDYQGECWYKGLHGQDTRFREPPDFTFSLDACFKWLVPKLEPLGYDLEISNDAKMLGWRASLHNRNSGCSIASPYEDFNEPDGAALALCKAIEQLIDKED